MIILHIIVRVIKKSDTTKLVLLLIVGCWLCVTVMQLYVVQTIILSHYVNLLVPIQNMRLHDTIGYMYSSTPFCKWSTDLFVFPLNCLENLKFKMRSDVEAVDNGKELWTNKTPPTDSSPTTLWTQCFLTPFELMYCPCLLVKICCALAMQLLQ